MHSTAIRMRESQQVLIQDQPPHVTQRISVAALITCPVAEVTCKSNSVCIYRHIFRTCLMRSICKSHDCRARCNSSCQKPARHNRLDLMTFHTGVCCRSNWMMTSPWRSPTCDFAAGSGILMVDRTARNYPRGNLHPQTHVVLHAKFT
jgi:hypothetical protein